MTVPGLHELPRHPLATSRESRLTARPLTLIVAGDVLPRACGCRDVSDGALGDRGEPRCAGATSSGGSYSTVMLRIHPVQGAGAAARAEAPPSAEAPPADATHRRHP